MPSGQLTVSNLGKAYHAYKSEWARVGRWFGLGVKATKQTWVLRDVSFSVSPGEAVAIVGKNGAGKSTLLKLITGVMQPTVGSLSLQGRVSAILELGMGFNPEFSARQNVRHSAGLMGFSNEQIEAKLSEIESFAEIGEYFDQPMRTYSSGMQMRVAFAVATAWQPDILIVDEALSVGDAFFQAKCFERIARYRAGGMTLLLVTHSVSDVVRLCSRALFLRAGRLVADGDARTVSNQYLDDLFGKSAADASSSNEAVTSAIYRSETDADVFSLRPGYRKDEHRWGHGGAAIVDFSVVCGRDEYPSQITSGESSRFLMKVRFDADYSNVVPGILIKTLDGIFLYGTNSYLVSSGKKAYSVRAGETQVFAFDVPITLNSGSYLVSLGISSGDTMETLVPLDRRYDAIVISVSRTAPMSGIVDLRASIYDAN